MTHRRGKFFKQGKRFHFITTDKTVLTLQRFLHDDLQPFYGGQSWTRNRSAFSQEDTMFLHV